MTRWLKAVSTLLAAGATAGSVVLFAQEKTAAVAPRPGAGAKAARLNDTPVFEVKRGMLRVVLIEPGALEASRSQDVQCLVEGSTTIISIVPEGTRVKKGDMVGELDSSSLRDQLVNQRIATQGAEVSYQIAKLTRQVAEIAVKEYVEGIYLQNKATIQGELKLAESSGARAEDRLDRIMKARKRMDAAMAAKGEDSTAFEILADIDLDDRIEREQMAVQRAKLGIEQAHSKETILENYEKPKTIQKLRSEVEKALSDEFAKKQTLQLAQDKEAKLKKEIANCKLLAPWDGIVVYANDPMRSFGSNQPQIEAGATVRERQKIFSLPDLSAPLVVNTKVRETMVAGIAAGQRARVRVHAFPASALPGVVRDLAPLPDPTSFFAPDPKVYTTRVTLDKSLPGLLPGMSAQVEMSLVDLDEVLSVPLQAVFELKGRVYVYLVTPSGPAKREVKLGLSNDTMIEVKEGLHESDRVALNPISVISDAELREAFAVSKEVNIDKATPAAAKAGKAVADTHPTPTVQIFQKFRNISPEDRVKLKSASDDERKAMLKKAGFTDEELQALQEMRKHSAPATGPGSSSR